MNIPKLVAKNLKKYGKAIGVKPCTLIKVTPGVRTAGALSGGTNPVETRYAATGFIEVYSDFMIAQSLVNAEDRKITLLGASIAGGQVPAKGDKIVIAEADGTISTYRIEAPVVGDGIGATYVCQGRR